MSTPRYIRARVTISNGKIVDQAVEGIQQVIKFDENGYPSPSQWERVRDLTEDEMKQLNISFVKKVGDEV